MNPRSLISISLLAAALAAPAAANAGPYDLYVKSGAGATSCAVDDPCSLDQAVYIANLLGDPNTIYVVGPLAYSGGVDLSRSPIDLVGSGSGAGGTTIDGGSADTAVKLAAGGSITDVAVASSHGGIEVVPAGTGSTTIERVDVDAHDFGVGITPTGAVGPTTVRDSHIAAVGGIYDAESPLTVERTTVVATKFGIWSSDAEASIRNSVVRTTAAGAKGVVSFNSAQVSIDGTTIDGGGVGDAGVVTGPSTPATARVDGSIVRGFATDLSATNGNPAGDVLTVSTSDYRTGGGGGFRDLGGTVDVDPHWVDPARGDYRLASDSPLIDRGPARAAAAGETDRAGNPRDVDGDNDGATARDLGAYEYQYVKPSQPQPQAPAGDPAPTPVVVQPEPQPQQQPQAPPVQMSAPAQLKAALGRIALSRRGVLTVPVTCSAAPCSVKLVVATIAGKPRTLARANGAAGRLQVRLSRSALKYVKRHKVRITVTATGSDGRSAQSTRTFTR